MSNHRSVISCLAVPLLLFLFPWSVFSEWNWKSPIPQGNTLFKVQFIDSLHGWAVGDYGTILRTTTGGTSWYEQEFARTDNILDITMLSPTEGWAVGDNGTILHTTDSGDDWLEQTSGITTGLNAVEFLDSLNGWTVGDNEIVLHTSNGGVTWEKQHELLAPSSINDVHFLTPSDGWAVGSSNNIFRTTDGGLTWISRVVGGGNTTLTSVTFTTPSAGFVVGAHGEVYRTANGGILWSPISIGDSINLNQIIMTNASEGWIVGDVGKSYHTTDGGITWSPTVFGDGSNINSIAQIGNHIWIVGEYGHIYHSTNDGSTWSPLDHGSRLSVNWVTFPSATVGYAVGQTGLIMRTTDAGESWVEQTSPDPTVSCYGIDCIDETHAWAVGDDGTIFRSVDGNIWSTQPSGITHSLFGIHFANSSAGWIVGGEFTNYTGIVLHTNDAGTSWVTQYNAVPEILFGVSFPTPSRGWAVGANGYITRTTDGGNTWTQQTSGTGANFFWCSFIDSSEGWAVGDSGKILHTNDAGMSWTVQPTGVTVSLYSITIVSSFEVFVAGDFGTILHTTNGGSTWEVQYSRTLYALFGIAHPPGSSVLASGDYGTVLKNTISPAGSATITSYVNAGWNVISLPLAVADRSKSTLYPTSLGSAFGYANPVYYVADTLVQGRGYWIQFPSAQTVSINGTPIAADTIDLAADWNLIGILSDSTPASSIATLPSGIITSNFFGFTGSYSTVQTLMPGVGYWVKASQAGKLVLHSPPVTMRTQSSSDVEELSPPLNTITICEQHGNGKSLYFGRNINAQLVNAYLLPPLPPSGCFDVRFGSGSEIASCGADSSQTASAVITIQAQDYPLKVSWHLSQSDHVEYRLLDGTTRLPITGSLSEDGNIIIKNRQVHLLILAATSVAISSVPGEFSLFQNYPNPFNPSTSIPFILPTESHVRLVIITTLGQYVTTLLDRVMDEGFHEVTWSPTMASGIYFYRLEAFSILGNQKYFTSTKKMVVLR
ncbi:MAG: hypothetical protein HY033_06435 [Ignavibacteriae bacterium]|nr:hypothetical protein [Ignavibacteria bacterium]MBI3364529.1 hypothetical protein [Ignavibacteriota bacterium]